MGAAGLTGGQKPHTLGILCDPEHPALNNFPTEYHYMDSDRFDPSIPLPLADLLKIEKK